MTGQAKVAKPRSRTKYEAMQPLLWRVADLESLFVPAFQLTLPATWHQVIWQAATSRSQGRRYVNPVWSSLHAVLKVRFPELISINYRGMGRERANWWLLAKAEVPAEEIARTVQEWFWLSYPEACQDEQALANLFTPGHVHWAPIKPAWRNGRPEGEHDWKLVPFLVAHALSEREEPMRLGPTGAELRWHRVAAPEGDGAQLISTPLVMPGKKGVDWFWTYGLRFYLLTLPGHTETYLALETFIRRYLSQPKDRPPRGKTTAYLRAPDSFHRGAGRRVFCTANVKWLKRGEEWDLIWADEVPELLNALHLSPLPEAEAVRQAPQHYLGEGHLEVGITYRNQMTHRVEPGVIPEQRHRIFRLISALFAHQLVPVGPFPRQRVPNNKYAKPVADDWVQTLREVAPDGLTIELWHRDPGAQISIEAALQRLLGCRKESETNTNSIFRTDGYQIRLAAYDWPDSLTNLIPRSEGHLARAGTVRAHVEATAGEASSYRLALVQIKDQIGKEGDAKDAVRLGFAGAGRCSQHFVMPAEQDGAKPRRKAPSAVGQQAKWQNVLLDLFRQFGHRPLSLRDQLAPTKLAVPVDQILALWLIRQNEGESRAQSALPVAVRMRTDGHVVEARVYNGPWEPYPLAQLRLASLKEVKPVDDAIGRWLREQIQEAIHGGTTLVLAEAQNLRRPFKWLADKHINFDSLFYGNATAFTTSPASLPGLRILRVREPSDGETPQWAAVLDRPVSEQDAAGTTSGLAWVDERVAYSLGPKPATLKTEVVKGEKEARPDKRGIMPAAVEFCWAFGQPGDEPAEFFQAVHLLREVQEGYSGPTRRPLPLHLAERLGAYLVGSDPKIRSPRD